MAKFRSYNKPRKQFIYFENGDYYHGDRYQCSSNIFDWANAEQSIDVCFFGDLVSNGEWSAEVVKHDNGGFGLKMESGAISVVTSWGLENLEVIGNIHE